MATFEELMEQYRNPGDNGLPESFADDLAAAYQNDLSVRDAAVNERENQLTEKENALTAKDAEINRLKAVNYDLLVAAPKSREPGVTEQQPDDAPRGIDSLFE